MNILPLFCSFVKTHSMSEAQKDLEIIALRSQLAVLQTNMLNQKLTKPRLPNRFRQLWVFLSQVHPRWKSALMLVQPETVLRWHREAFKRYWRRKSVGGRPAISKETIALIKRIHRENPTLSPEKIYDACVT